jgi:hypothetical protein
VKTARWLTPALVAVLLWAAQVTAQAPLPVVERVVVHLGRTTRVTLFSNHVAVVTIRSDTDDFVRSATLTIDEYMVYLKALEHNAAEIGDDPVTSDVEAVGSTTTLTLHLGPEAPRTLVFSPLASLDLASGKIISIMDDIQLRVLSTMPGEDAIREWQPEVDDCVELRRGGSACVVAITQDGTVVLRDQATSVMTTVPPADRAEIILRVIEDGS